MVKCLPIRKVKVATAANFIFHLQKAASQGAKEAIQCADRFHVCKNLTEATQLLLARCQAEIVAASKAGEPKRADQPKQLIMIEEWRPPEPAHVQKARLTRRAGRYARYRTVGGLTGARHEDQGDCAAAGNGRTHRAGLA